MRTGISDPGRSKLSSGAPAAGTSGPDSFDPIPPPRSVCTRPAETCGRRHAETDFRIPVAARPAEHHPSTCSGIDFVKGALAQALQLLAHGMTPFVTERLRAAYGPEWHRRVATAPNSPPAPPADPDSWDAHTVLLLMWDHWNRAFRHDLTFTERCLVSELREYRNRWAHQQAFTERDTYRCLDSIARLLASVDSPAAASVEELRRESLHRLHDEELVETRPPERDLFTAGVTAVCGIILAVTVLKFFPTGYAWGFAALTVLVFTRLVLKMLQPITVVTGGPRQCSECSRVYYGNVCPYCEPSRPVPQPVPRPEPLPNDSSGPERTAARQTTAGRC